MLSSLPRRRVAALAATTLVLGLATAAVAAPRVASSGGPASSTPAVVVSAALAERLAAAAPDDRLTVFLRADTLDHARAAVTGSGLAAVTEWHSIGTEVGVGTPAQVRSALRATGLVHAEVDAPVALDLDTAHEATRMDVMRATMTDADSRQINGAGVTIAITDSGADGTHPFLTLEQNSKVMKNLRINCPVDVGLDASDCFTDLSTTTNNSDDASAGGRGTHVSGIAAGYDTDVPTPAGVRHLYGAAAGAKVVMLSVGASETLLNTNEAFQWILDHQRRPCADADDQAGPVDPECPPIRVESNSFGPSGAVAYDPESASVLLNDKMVGTGIAIAWAAGNSGGSGTEDPAETNPSGQNPTPGVVMVAAYDDGNAGDPDNKIASYSSRGNAMTPSTWPDISAPGSTITSSCRSRFSGCMGNPQFASDDADPTTMGDFQTISGTSMATPYVAGVMADLFQANPSLTPADVEKILKDTAHRYTDGAAYVDGADGTDTDTPSSFDKGHGLVDALAAVEMAQHLAITPFPALRTPRSRCAGVDLVEDAEADAIVPIGPGDPTSGDITSITFASDATNLTTTVNLADLEPVAGGASTDAIYTVVWSNAQNGRTYATQASLPDPTGVFAYAYGEWDRGTAAFVGTSSTADGSMVMGTGGSASVVVPLADIGSPTIPVAPGAAPAVTDTLGTVVFGEGVLVPLVTFTGIVDTAPNSGVGPSWSVCGDSGPAEVTVVTAPAAPVALAPAVPPAPAPPAAPAAPAAPVLASATRPALAATGLPGSLAVLAAALVGTAAVVRRRRRAA